MLEASERNIYMKYKVIYKEVLHHEFEVEANSREEAKKEFERLADAGEIDFSYGEVIDTETIIRPEEANKQSAPDNLLENLSPRTTVTESLRFSKNYDISYMLMTREQAIEMGLPIDID